MEQENRSYLKQGRPLQIKRNLPLQDTIMGLGVLEVFNLRKKMRCNVLNHFTYSTLVKKFI